MSRRLRMPAIDPMKLVLPDDCEEVQDWLKSTDVEKKKDRPTANFELTQKSDWSGCTVKQIHMRVIVMQRLSEVKADEKLTSSRLKEDERLTSS